jgi:predicted transporter
MALEDVSLEMRLLIQLPLVVFVEALFLSVAFLVAVVSVAVVSLGAVVSLVAAVPVVFDSESAFAFSSLPPLFLPA